MAHIRKNLKNTHLVLIALVLAANFTAAAADESDCDCCCCMEELVGLDESAGAFWLVLTAAVVVRCEVSWLMRLLALIAFSRSPCVIGPSSLAA